MTPSPAAPAPNPAAAWRVVVTRPAAQAGPWVQALRQRGVQAEALPLIGIEPVADPAPLQRCWAALGAIDWAMFVSANAVEHFFAARPPGLAWPQALPAGAPGPATAEALRAQGVPQVDEPLPGQADSEGLWARVRHRPWQGRRVLVVRGEDGRDWLADQFGAAGAQVQHLCAYRRVPPPLGPEAQALLAQALAEPARHLWHFGSSEAVGQLRAWAPQARWHDALACAGHARIAEAARALGFGRVLLLPPAAGVEASVAALLRVLEPLPPAARAPGAAPDPAA